MTKQEIYNHNYTLRVELSNLHKIYDRITEAMSLYEELREETKARVKHEKNTIKGLLDAVLVMIDELEQEQAIYNQENLIK